MAKDLKREQLIFDKGYEAVRRMATELVENGATLSDILFHANQVWHEFKVGAMNAGVSSVVETGMYIDLYNADATNKIITADNRYKDGADALRVAQYANAAKAGR